MGGSDGAANKNAAGSLPAPVGGAAAGDSASSSQLGSALPDAVQRAIAASGARPTSGASSSEVARQVASSSDLRETFVSSVEATIRRRLSGDADFKDDPDRFPATKKLFEDKDRRK